MNRKLNTKDHRSRKSPGSAELWRKQKKQRNAARPKQLTIEEHSPDGTVKITGPFRDDLSNPSA